MRLKFSARHERKYALDAVTTRQTTIRSTLKVHVLYRLSCDDANPTGQAGWASNAHSPKHTGAVAANLEFGTYSIWKGIWNFKLQYYFPNLDIGYKVWITS